jgi:hypothetical protein
MEISVGRMLATRRRTFFTDAPFENPLSIGLARTHPQVSFFVRWHRPLRFKSLSGYGVTFRIRSISIQFASLADDVFLAHLLTS